MSRVLIGRLAVVGIGLPWWLLATPVLALPTPEASLNTCQATVQAQGKRFVQNTINAIGTCLKKVSVDVIKNSGAITASTSATCVSQFRKINDTRVPDKSIEEKFRTAVDKRCNPTEPNVAHTLNDITAQAAGGVTEKIKSVNIDTWCKHFGGDGSIDTVAEWENCLVNSFNCEAAAAIAAQFPRSAEWLASLLLPANMPAVPAPASDLTKTTDAVSGASDTKDLVDPDGDGIPNPRCGGEGAACATACCYVENIAIGPPGDVTCFEYTGPAAQLGGFMGACLGPSSMGSMVKTPVLTPCPALPSPMMALPCAAPPIMVIIPSDATCP